MIEARHLDLADAEAALSLFEPAQLELLCAEARRRVEGLPPGSPRLADARARLALMLRHLATPGVH